MLRRLRRVAPTLAVAGLLADAGEAAEGPARAAILEDPVLRAATQHALTELLTGSSPGLSLETCAAVMRIALEQIEREAPEGLMAAAAPSCAPLGPEPWHGWIWCEEPRTSVAGDAFRELIQLNFGGSLMQPTAAQIQVLTQARELIEEVTPEIGASALGHAHGIGVFPSSGRWQTMAGASQFWVTGLVFLAGEMLQDPWWVAEHLLHEALHQKLYDLRHTHSLLLRDAASEGAGPPAEPRGRIVSLWNKVDAHGSNAWGVSRSLAAFHVYVHLAVYARLAEAHCAAQGGRPYSERGVTGASSAFRRATYLGQQLRVHYVEDLGPAGNALVDWLMQCLEALAPLPASGPLQVSLLLERYGREAERLKAAADAGQAPGDLADAAERAVTLISAEADEVAEILRAAAAEEPVEPFLYDHFGEGSEDDRLQAIPRDSRDGVSPSAPPAPLLVAASHRRLRIRDALANVLVYGEVAPDAPAYAQAARMIERSSLELMPLFVSDASDGQAVLHSTPDPRGQLLLLTDIIGEGFGTSDFGLFLYSIVRMHMPASIVELGTGRGTCAFWMALAAKRNGAGHVWTVDDDSMRQDWERVMCARRDRLRGTPWAPLAEPHGAGALAFVRGELGLEDELTFVSRTIDLSDPRHFDDYPFTSPVDLLFSDFRHGVKAVLQILGQFLPRMAPSSSILIDGASASWPSYLLLEQLVAQLNDRRIPALLQEHSPVPLGPVMATRRLRLVHLTDPSRQVQNSTAWLLLEPDDLRPYPLTAMHGLPL